MGGQDGIDLYNQKYFKDIHPTITVGISFRNEHFIIEKVKTNEKNT